MSPQLQTSLLDRLVWENFHSGPLADVEFYYAEFAELLEVPE